MVSTSDFGSENNGSIPLSSTREKKVTNRLN